MWNSSSSRAGGIRASVKTRTVSPATDDEQGGETLVPERGVERSDAGRIVLVDGDDYDGRDVLNAQYGRYAQVVESRAQCASVRHVANVVRFFVEVWRATCGKTQEVFPRWFKRARRCGVHHSRLDAPIPRSAARAMTMTSVTAIGHPALRKEQTGE